MSILEKKREKCLIDLDDDVEKRRFILIHARDLQPQEMESLRDMGKVLKWTPRLTNISVSDLVFDYLCIKLSKASREFVMTNMHHCDKDPFVHVIAVHDVKEQWVKASGCETRIKRVPKSIPEHMKSIYNDSLLQGHIKLPKSTNFLVKMLKKFMAALLTLVGCSAKKYKETKDIFHL